MRSGVFDGWKRGWFARDLGKDVEVLGHLERARVGCDGKGGVDEGVDNGVGRASESGRVHVDNGTVVCHHLALHGHRYRRHACRCCERRLSMPFREFSGAATGPRGDTPAQLLKDAFFLCFPVPVTSLFQYTRKFILCILSLLFNGRDEVLFVREPEVACDVRVLKWLERRKCCRSVELVNEIGQGRRVYVCLRQQVVPIVVLAFCIDPKPTSTRTHGRCHWTRLAVGLPVSASSPQFGPRTS